MGNSLSFQLLQLKNSVQVSSTHVAVHQQEGVSNIQHHFTHMQHVLCCAFLFSNPKIQPLHLTHRGLLFNSEYPCPPLQLRRESKKRKEMKNDLEGEKKANSIA